MRKRLRLLSIFALVLVPLLVSCGVFEIRPYEVQNNSSERLLARSGATGCNDERVQSRAGFKWTSIHPGTTETFLGVGSAKCLLIADLNESVLFSQSSPESRRYVVGPDLRVTVDETVEVESPLGDFPKYAWLFAVGGLVFALAIFAGFLIAMFISVRFFYRFYISKSSRTTP